MSNETAINLKFAFLPQLLKYICCDGLISKRMNWDIVNCEFGSAFVQFSFVSRFVQGVTYSASPLQVLNMP